MVPWISSDEHCTGILLRLPKIEKIVQWLKSLLRYSWGGIQYKSRTCPFPCTAMFSHATLKHAELSDFQTNYVHLYFDDSIEEEKIIPAYDLAALLVEIGSSLGLWLGLSVVGVFDILVFVTLRIKQLFKQIFKNLQDRHLLPADTNENRDGQELDASTREDDD